MRTVRKKEVAIWPLSLVFLYKKSALYRKPKDSEMDTLGHLPRIHFSKHQST